MNKKCCTQWQAQQERFVGTERNGISSDLHYIVMSNLLVRIGSVIVHFNLALTAETHTPPLNWNDLRLLLAVTEAGSLNATAARL